LLPKQVLLDVRGLSIDFATEHGAAHAVSDVSFQVFEDEVFAIVGESGCGKTVTALSLMRLIPRPPGEIVAGEIIFKGRDLLRLPIENMRKIRGKEIAMIFQEPMTSLNPVFTIGMQVREMIQQHEQVSGAVANERAVEMLRLVGIPDAHKRLHEYPHLFSGGMRQRVMIAMSLACNPSLLIADEPTTALDVTIQAQILDLMIGLKEKRPGSAIILITHNLGVVAETCHRVAVMYGGKIQELAPVADIFAGPLHPYTQGLLASLPGSEKEGKQKRLRAIPGMVPNIHQLPKGCKFCTRCPVKEPACETLEPVLHEVVPDHWVRCHLVTPQLLKVKGSIPNERRTDE
jgi:oligopeptide/dipeptide ABC transporter ATP-binding protein